jgi:hypothetical protein
VTEAKTSNNIWIHTHGDQKKGRVTAGKLQELLADQTFVGESPGLRKGQDGVCPLFKSPPLLVLAFLGLSVAACDSAPSFEAGKLPNCTNAAVQKEVIKLLQYTPFAQQSGLRISGFERITWNPDPMNYSPDGKGPPVHQICEAIIQTNGGSREIRYDIQIFDNAKDRVSISANFK